MSEHQIKTCNCGEPTCPICEWGASICSVCGKAEVELSEPCVVPTPPESTEVCERCEGTGQFHLNDEPGDRTYARKCPTCKGTGKPISKEVKPNGQREIVSNETPGSSIPPGNPPLPPVYVSDCCGAPWKPDDVCSICGSQAMFEEKTPGKSLEEVYRAEVEACREHGMLNGHLTALQAVADYAVQDHLYKAIEGENEIALLKATIEQRDAEIKALNRALDKLLENQ